MRQRVMIAIALSCEPDLLIADEPTTALDVTIQRQILDLLRGVQRERDMAMMLISHDLAVVAGRTDRVSVMYAGRLAEVGSTREVFDAPRHRYTHALLGATPTIDHARHAPLRVISGSLPDPTSPATGLPLRTAMRPCAGRLPRRRARIWHPSAPTMHVACLHPVTTPTREDPHGVRKVESHGRQRKRTPTRRRRTAQRARTSSSNTPPARAPFRRCPRSASMCFPVKPSE